MDLIVEPLTDEGGEQYGVLPSALSNGISITGDSISGELKYYDGADWDEGTWSEEESKGHFLMLSFEDCNGTVESTLIGGKSEEPLTVDDGFCVYRITDPKKQKIKISVTGGTGGDNEIIYRLGGLTLLPDPGED